ncbi:MAG: DUF2971 domain-containing protein [Candidatus Thermoplasmatota archaeon]|nr:DUF2971 domain-containing protein [Candidatus Thermoplasmatota archaeon]
MYKKYDKLILPKDETIKIWRFQDFTKFVSVLNNNSLFFPFASKLNDPFEGKISNLTIEYLKKNIDEDILIQSFKCWYRLRDSCGVNSWHINNHESAAMWKLYLKSNEGIAIQSTVKKLKNCFKNNLDDDIFIGKVIYFNHFSEVMPLVDVFTMYMYKSKSFDYEKELRAITYRIDKKEKVKSSKKKSDNSFEENSNGFFVSCDLDILIDKIVVSPTSDNWFKELVESTIEKYDFKKQVIISNLTERPLY